MSRGQGFMLFALPALSTIVMASDGKTPGATAGTSATEPANERGVQALFSLGDFDGDGRLDLAAVSGDGTLQLLANAGEGRFEDVTERVGLSDVKNAALALWADYDGDGRVDLFVGAREGASRLFHNERGAFVDMSAGSGLASNGAVQSAQWLDLDGDGRLDLFVVTEEKSKLCTRLFRGLEGGFFEQAELPLGGGVSAPGVSASLMNANGAGKVGQETPADPGISSEKRGSRGGSMGHSANVDGANTSGGRIALGPTPTVGGVTPLVAFPINCANSIRDQGNPGTCLSSSTTPTLGMLYPISANLFVATGGNVGIGTTSPGAKLEVAGTTRMTNTLTLNPAGDQALDVSTGSIYKGGALFIHTRGGANNTALGRLALSSVTTGYNNTASGVSSLSSNTFGDFNTADGYRALSSNTTGHFNTASGAQALSANTTGLNNTADGYRALVRNTNGGANTASGSQALYFNTTGRYNTASGYRALYANSGGVMNTATGVLALYANTIGSYNTAIGVRALYTNSTGSSNTACGRMALYRNFTGIGNTACGEYALGGNFAGSRNTALGALAGSNLTGNDNIAIGNPGVSGEASTTRIGTSGTHTRAFVAGIRGVTTGVADAIPVVVDSAGQLGTVSSSRRFKKDIADMGERTEKLLELRPVVFHYKQEQKGTNGGEPPLEYGLIAEEVAEIFPDLVVYDEEGKPFTVKYHLLSAMLLNEMKKQHEELEAQARELGELEELRGELTRLRGLESRLAAVEDRAAR